MVSFTLFALAAAAAAFARVGAQSASASASVEITAEGTPSPGGPVTICEGLSDMINPAECWVLSTSGSAIYFTPVTTTGAMPTDVPDVTGTSTFCEGDGCWEVFTTAGGVAAIPITRTTLFATGTGAPVATSSPGPVEGLSASSGPGKGVTVVLPAVLGSLIGVALLVLGFVLVKRYRKTPNREWVNRPGGWTENGVQTKGASEMSEADVDGIQNKV